MTTIVLNTLKLAVTEYDWEFQSLTPTHAGDAAGLYTLGGDTDAGEAIAAEVRGGRSLLGSERKKAVPDLYYALRGAGEGTAVVEGDSGVYTYDFAVRATGVSRAAPGRGISENYLALGYRNKAGVDFRLDRIDADVVPSKQRRS